MTFANLSGGRDSSAMVVKWLESGERLVALAICERDCYGAKHNLSYRGEVETSQQFSQPEILRPFAIPSPNYSRI